MTVTSEAPVAYRSTAARPGPIGLIAEAAREIGSRRRLIRYLVEAQLKKKGADTLLGNIWWVLDPLLQMLVYVVLVTVVAGRLTPDYPLFIFAAILPWKWFTSSVQDGLTSVVGQERLIKQVRFPKIVLPVAATAGAVVSFGFGLIPLLALMLLFYGARLSPLLVLVPVIAAVQLVFTLGVTVLLSAVNVFFRDLGNVSRHALRLWFYLSPALYSLDQVRAFDGLPPAVKTLMEANPFAILFEAYRAVIYGTTTSGPIPPNFVGLVGLLGLSLVLLGLSTIAFKRVEPAFAKVL